MTLLAFEDVSKSKLSELVENSQKIKVASEVNHELLKSQSKDTGQNFFFWDLIWLDSKISTLMKMLLWSQNRLKEKVNFPIITNLATSEFSNES
jgi:Ran binding protein in the microtubule-organising centre.